MTDHNTLALGKQRSGFKEVRMDAARTMEMGADRCCFPYQCIGVPLAGDVSRRGHCGCGCSVYAKEVA